METPYPRYPAKYGAFVHSFDAKKIYLTHVSTWSSQDLTNWWCYSHAGAVIDQLVHLDLNADVSIPVLGKKVIL
ncbi:MAG: hypothetical protein ACOX8S_06635 [Christensenellales bacterium]|jgi:hypothetical protein